MKGKFDQDQLLILRSCLGKWTRESDRAFIRLKTNDEEVHGSSRNFKVEASFPDKDRTIRVYYKSNSEIFKYISYIQSLNFKQTEPLFPDLQQYFRNGLPVTHEVLLKEAIESIATNDNKVIITDDNFIDELAIFF